MKKQASVCILTIILLFAFSGCGIVNDKTANLSIVYAVTAVLSFAILVGHCFFGKKKGLWYSLLFSSVLVVNVGYLWLSASSELNTALMANRIAYLGSVLLPFSMLMITLDTVKIKCRRWVIGVLLAISGIMFLIAASQGYLDIYYKDAALITTANGYSMLKKDYGPLHPLYLVYLVGYFGTMVGITVYSHRKKTAESTTYTLILMIAVFVNIGVWFIEQLVSLEFEMLSVSYVISELFLLGLNMLMAEHEKTKKLPAEAIQPQPQPRPAAATVEVSEDVLQIYKAGLEELTKTEKLIYNAYIEGKSTKEILAELNIKENTLKFHNKNIYGKLGVSSRKQLVEIAKAL